ncbi:MAG: hypothetical protein EXR62_16950 [Chloroflexi bacterium]|nr:hypothetical protein [Chloroflexota bacterium]
MPRLPRSVELTSGEITSHFDVIYWAISQPQRVNVKAGLLSIGPEESRPLFQDYLEQQALRNFLGEFWGHALRILKQAAEAEELRSRQDTAATEPEEDHHTCKK